ncbi:hypothetical protein [Methylotenera versatilis]|uniref:Uncharacterized protein n=1 Tax=Methylotenera versatilis (strain 301) TaxID=666681 RepID=D7DMT0_METV0|nr:hypothetical protein [Methylotenera versatilis]ADI30857.1 hypothetical protein M301_2497 [Methylotenera versatilis 301]
MLNELIQSKEFVAAVIGGVIAGFFSILATKMAFKHQQGQSENNEKIIISSLLQAIHDELETVYERYQVTMGARLESIRENEPLNFYYPLVSDFFSVYNGNTFLIGRINDNDLRKQIIKTYTLSKGMVDSFRLNNDLVHKFEYANKLYEETKQEVHKQHAIAHYNSLISYAATLKQGHGALKSEIFALLRTLRKNGVLSELAK